MQATLKKSVKRLFLAVAAAILLTASSTVTYANSVYYLMPAFGGGTLWLSCGSSAGNYIALCPAGGGECTVDQGTAQQEADQMCYYREMMLFQ